jgi:hypothetical protein
MRNGGHHNYNFIEISCILGQSMGFHKRWTNGHPSVIAGSIWGDLSALMCEHLNDEIPDRLKNLRAMFPCRHRVRTSNAPEEQMLAQQCRQSTLQQSALSAQPFDPLPDQLWLAPRSPKHPE